MNAKKDENGRPTITALSNVDGTTVVPIYAQDSSLHSLSVNDGAGGSDVGNNDGNAMMDENSVATMTVLSSADDGTIINLYADPLTSKLLIQTT